MFRFFVDDGYVFKLLKDKKDVFYKVIVFLGFFMFLGLGFGLLFFRIYLFLISVSGFFLFFIYVVIMVIYICFCKKIGYVLDGKF